MSHTVTAAYSSVDAARNAVDELISDGFDREKVFLDPQTNEVKVIVPESIRREAEEILQRHQPKEIR